MTVMQFADAEGEKIARAQTTRLLNAIQEMRRAFADLNIEPPEAFRWPMAHSKDAMDLLFLAERFSGAHLVEIDASFRTPHRGRLIGIAVEVQNGEEWRP